MLAVVLTGLHPDEGGSDLPRLYLLAGRSRGEENSSSVAGIFVRLAFRAAFFLEDAIDEILTEIRAGTDILRPDIYLVQVLEPEDVAVA